jgi:hypothetical protein
MLEPGESLPVDVAVLSAIVRDRYDLGDRLGSGGMGVVHRARHLRLRRDVAIKFCTSADPEHAQRLVREGKLLSRLSHPNLVQVFDAEFDGTIAWIALELVEGEDLRDRMARGSLELAEAVRIATLMLHGLQEAHSQGIVHRDINPENILLTSAGAVKLADFGLARELRSPCVTADGGVLGTAHYGAPELLAGLSADHRSDLYSVGVVLYELVTGRRPFEASDDSTLIRMHLSEPPADPRSLRPDLPDGLAAVVLAALAKDAGARPASAAELATRLGQSVGTGSPPARATRSGAPPQLTLRRSPGASLVVAGLLAAAAAGACIWLAIRTGLPGAAASASASATSSGPDVPEAPSGPDRLVTLLTEIPSVDRRTRSIDASIVLVDDALQRRRDAIMSDRFLEVVRSKTGLKKEEIRRLAEGFARSWKRRIRLFPRVTTAREPDRELVLEAGSRRVAFVRPRGLPAAGDGIEIHVLPGTRYRLVLDGRARDFRAPPAPLAIDFRAMNARGILAQCYSLGERVRLQIVDAGTDRTLARSTGSDGAPVAPPPSLVAWSGGASPGRQLLIELLDDHGPVPLYHEIIAVRLPSTEEFDRALESRMMAPLADFVEQRFNLAVTVSAGVTAFDSPGFGEMKTPEARTLGYQFGVMARQYPGPRVAAWLTRVLSGQEPMPRLRSSQLRELSLGAVVSRGHIGRPAHIDELAGRLSPRTTIEDALYLFWALAVTSHPRARQLLPEFLDRIEGSRATLRNWAKLWLWIAPKSFMQWLRPPHTPADGRQESRRRLLIEGALLLGVPDSVPALALLDPGSDPPDLVAEAMILLEFVGDPAARDVVARWERRRGAARHGESRPENGTPGAGPDHRFGWLARPATRATSRPVDPGGFRSGK